jgi:CBS domain-containing protein
MLVKESMTVDVKSIHRGKTVMEACVMYRDYQIGSLLVTDNEGCVGIVTERDIIERTICGHKDPYSTNVSEIMSSKIITVHPLDEIGKAVEKLIEFHIKKLPVVQGDEIVGIITVTDIARSHPELAKRVIEKLAQKRNKDKKNIFEYLPK